jgi:integrase
MDDFRIIQPTYKNKSGESVKADHFYVEFRDHNRGRQKLKGYANLRDTERFAERIMELVTIRRQGETLAGKLRRWVEGLDPTTSKRLIDIGLIDSRAVDTEKPLSVLLKGRADESSAIIEPGYQQALEARGNSKGHIDMAVGRVDRILAECGFLVWRDLTAPGATTRIEVAIGKWRAEKKIGGQSCKYYVRDMKSFARWLCKAGLAPSNPVENLEAVANAEMDTDKRRALSVDEMKLLVEAAGQGEPHNGMDGQDRALLYRFAFESGLRPGQIRSLTPANFTLDGDSPSVTAHARYVKRRKSHTQPIEPSLAADLKRRFATMMPAAPAFKMPSKYHMARMLRKDLAAARDKWIDDAKDDPKGQEQRQRSDFLADVNRDGERAVFYSTRHGCGTALAESGANEMGIAKAMHHSSRAITARYLHTERKAVALAMESLPDLSFEPKRIATGTDSGAVDAVGTFPQPFPNPPRTSPMVGQNDQFAVGSASPENSGNPPEIAGFQADSESSASWRNGRRYGLKIR